MAIYYDLVMRCPACIASGGSGGTPGQWYHRNCGGRLQVGDNACYLCTKCPTELHVRDWRYACGEHASDYRPTTSAHLANAISTAGQITGVAGRQWLMRFLDAMGDF
jgi:hypothetical protein